MFVPNARAEWLKKAAKRSITGKESFFAPQPIAISVVDLKDTSAHTSVRADSSASRGAAEQHEATAKILAGKQFDVKCGDLLRVYGYTLEVSIVQPRADVMGRLDHLELDCHIRADL
ncbi:hypothetical protein SAMN03159338_1603 [Sphingomonas sp. NFR04]|uniref:hypothetical protein n=1 Tax=Sphingomonas sp. NFR04 TaxID=1566283 RepID=UPI0008E9C760|nr:hypothetical protein [Sphingomonas sp. NFR04]SFJ50755.1 hypothetical protein SAMN03159338_1603 [Sphingomonas sp. NFR04]